MKYTTLYVWPRRILGMIVLLGLAVSPATGSTIIPTRDLGDLARASDAVLLARAGVSFGQAHDGFIYTYTSFEVLNVVSGVVQGSIIVETPGGVVDGQGWVVGGSPR